MSNENEKLEFVVEAARRDFLGFCMVSDQYWQTEPHHELMANKLQDVADGKIKRLILMLPPRSGKSRIVQEFCAWYLGKNPNKSIINTGHSQGLLENFSRLVRDRVNSDMYKLIFPDTKVRDDSSAVDDWKTTTQGTYMIFGVGAGVTGRGFDIGFIDDPYSGRQEAESDTTRMRIYEWYRSTFFSRRQDENSAIVIIMQRWREDDLVGRLMEEEAGEWEVVKIPAIGEVNGEKTSYWPSKFSVKELEDMRSKNEYYFMSQYQQDPTNDESGVFTRRMFSYCSMYELPKDKEVITFVDPAISKNQGADYTAIVTINHDRRTGLVYVVDVCMEKLFPDEIIDKLFSIYQRFRPDKVGIEVVQYQKMLAQQIKKEMVIRNIFFSLEEIRPMGEKNSRISSVLRSKYSNSQILHVREAKVELLEDQLLKFPTGKHDDGPDALSGAVALINNKGLDKPITEVKRVSGVTREASGGQKTGRPGNMGPRDWMNRFRK